LSPSASNEQVQVIITNNNSAVESALSTFVSAYNKVIQDLNTQEGKDSSGNAEPLYGSPTVANLQQSLQSAMNFTQSSGAITSMMQLGITVNTDGTLSLNSDTLDSILNSNYQAVINFLQPGGSFTSFGGNLTSVLNNLGNSSSNGAIKLAVQENAAIEQQLNLNISNEETIISAKKTQLTNELNQANYVLTAIPQQLQQINEIYSAITGYNQQKG
jgi:flagellar hook-associated protein 2